METTKKIKTVLIPEGQYIGTQTFADNVGFTLRYVDELIRRRKIKCYRISRTVRIIPLTEFEKYVAKREARNATKRELMIKSNGET